MTDYISRYGLEYNPFLKTSKQIYLDTSESREVVERLSTLGETKGIGILTGEPGNGKSTAFKTWSSSLSPSLFKVSYNSLSSLTVMDFYRQIAGKLGIEPRFHKNDLFNDIQEEIHRLAIEKRITPVIIIDEADQLSHKVLHDLQSLLNFDMDSRDLAILLLVGQPRLNNTLNQNMHESLRQRIIMNYHMGGLTKEESRTYINTKLEKAGSHQTVFDTNATEAIINAANGIPRMINKICNRSMMIGKSCGDQIINAETVMKAIDDCILG